MPFDVTDQPDAGLSGDRPAKPWLGVHFVCAGAYVRIYRNRAATAYTGACPRCGKRVHFRVAPGGTNRRFFEVSCEGAR